MNNSALAGMLVPALIWLTGCSSASVKSTSQTQTGSQPPAANLSAEPQHVPSNLVQQAAAKPAAPFEGEGWELMFDGKTLKGWRQTAFAGRSEVRCEAGLLVLDMGDPFTGVNWTNDFPKVNYEVALDAMRIAGSDFFCGLTVPVQDSFCSLIVGGWGGSLMGISSLNRMDASENETTRFMTFEQNRWYRIRLRVTEKRIEAWLDQEKVINVDISDKTISLRPGDIELSKPFGLASWQTTAVMRGIRMRHVDGPAGPLK